MHNYGFYLENTWGKPRTGKPQQTGEATVKPRDDQSEGVWEIDKKYSDLETLYAQRRLTGLTWHVDGQEVFVPLSSAGEIGSKEPFVFSVALPADDGSNYSYFHTFELESDETFTYTQTKIAGGVETAFQVVGLTPDGKPDVSDPSTQIIYLTKDPDSSATDPYTEWIYTADGQWEIIGETSIDLSDYYTSAQVDEKISEVSGEASEAIGELREAKADKVTSATEGNFAGLDENGNLTDSGSKASDFKTKQSPVNVEGLGNTKTITALTQNANGEISASVSDIRSASTSQTGIVRLNDSTDSVSTSQAATANAVKKAYDHADALVAGLDAEVTSTDGTNVQVKVTEADGKITAVSVADDSINATDLETAIDALDSEATSSDGTNVQVKVTEVDGVVTAVNVTTDNTINATDLANAIDALDVDNITGLGADKTITSLSETDGKIEATANPIQIAESQVTNLTTDLSNKADKVSGAVTGNFASLDANGNLADSGSKASDFKTKQTAVTDPTASGDTLAFIDSITQNENGEIVVTKKNVDKAGIVPTPDTPDKLLTSGEDGAYDWQQLEKSTWGTELTDAQGTALVDENGNAVMDENAVDLWTRFNNTGFGAERAAADVEGNSIIDTYATKSEVSELSSEVDNKINALDAEVTSNDGTNVQVTVTEVDGKVTAVNITSDTTAANDHVHGQISNDGKIGSTANLAIVTGTSGVVTTSDLTTASPAATSDEVLEFIDTVSQDSKGQISATKKKVKVVSTYSGTGTDPVNGTAVKAAIDDLNVSEIGGAGKVITTISETAGKISATAVDYTDIVPAPDADDTLFTGSSDGTTDWQPLEKSAWGTVITDGESNLVDENGNAIMDENEVDLWTAFKGVGFGAERALADVAGNPLALTIESGRVTAIGSKPIGVGVEMTLAEVDQVVAQCHMPDYVPEI